MADLVSGPEPEGGSPLCRAQVSRKVELHYVILQGYQWVCISNDMSISASVGFRAIVRIWVAHAQTASSFSPS